MINKLTYKETFNCVVLDVKKIEGHGVTIDVILTNGVLREKDKVCLMGFKGVITS